MVGQMISNYKILEKIGEGGMGTVYKGIDVILKRQVAIKLLRPELIHNPHIIERFRIEAMALARLNHPNIVMLYSFFPQEGQFLMVLEFVQGETLNKIIKRCGAIPWQQAIPLVCQALDGLEHAHNLKVIHRDIKPANLVLMPSGILKLMDFGIARILETSRLTRTGYLLGTLEYMSPEQIQGKKIDSRADIYSLGIVLYEMLTGHVPFIRDSDFELLKAQVEELPLPPRKLMPQLPLALERVVLQALAKKPEERFQSAAEFRTKLEKIMTVTSPLYDSWQTRLSRPETGLKTPLSYSKDLLSDSGRVPPASRKSLLNYINCHLIAVVSIIVFIGIAILIGIAYRLGTRATLQEPSGIISKPTVSTPSQEPSAVIQPPAGSLQTPIAVTNSIQPTSAKEPSWTTPGPETIQQPIIPDLENPKPKTAENPALLEQPSLLPIAPISKKENPKPEQSPQAKSKPKTKPRTSAGRGEEED